MKTIDVGMPTLIETNSIESCVKLCKELGLDFIELNMNLPQYQKEFAMEGIELLLESSVFALTFDIGHSHSVNGIDEPFLNKHIDRLYHMHVHDAKGRENHLSLGTGEINMCERFFLAREHNCRVVLEIKTIEGLKHSVEKMTNYL
jgi:sugar phosphate isomerase/epimerase